MYHAAECFNVDVQDTIGHCSIEGGNLLFHTALQVRHLRHQQPEVTSREYQANLNRLYLSPLVTKPKCLTHIN